MFWLFLALAFSQFAITQGDFDDRQIAAFVEEGHISFGKYKTLILMIILAGVPLTHDII